MPEIPNPTSDMIIVAAALEAVRAASHGDIDGVSAGLLLLTDGEPVEPETVSAFVSALVCVGGDLLLGMTSVLTTAVVPGLPDSIAEAFAIDSVAQHLGLVE
jgi:hypothetical protein